MSGKNTMSIYDLTKKPIAWIDLTTYCNAGCPQCHRTNPNGLGKVDWLPLIQWKFEEFKQAWPVESLNTISKFEICGTWGDPIMVKDIYKICEYVINESDVFIQMNTNGGMRDTDFWWDMGLLGNKNRMQVIFDIEGINQEMHEHYRRKVNFAKLRDNVMSYTAARGNAFAHVLMFKHNEDYIDDIIKMAIEEWGCTDYMIQPSNRFNVKGYEDFIDENGKPARLEETTQFDHPQIKTKKSPAPLRDHNWWEKTGNELVYNRADHNNEKFRGTYK